MYAGNSELSYDNDNKNNNYVTFILDSGCNQHMVKDPILYNVKNLNLTIGIVEKDREMTGDSCENIDVKCIKSGKEIMIRDVLYLKGLRKNLLSVSQIEQKSFTMNVGNKKIDICKNGETYATIYHKSGLYFITFLLLNKPESNYGSYPSPNNSQLDLWHRRFGHLNYTTLKEMIVDKNVRFKGCW